MVRSRGPLWRHRNKYGVDLTEFGKIERTYKGNLYASKAEMRRAVALDLLIQAGEVRSWRRQVAYPLVCNGCLITRHYVDFVVTMADGSIHCEDVKGRQDRASKLTHKLFAACYPDMPYPILWARDV